jgi:UDPglucose 6-dehydrogenase
MYQICQALNIDYDKVIEYARYDERLGNSHWSVPGPDGDFGFSGSCFPKDIQSLIHQAKLLGLDPSVLEAAWNKNLKVRPGKDWETLKGRAVSDTNN